VNKIKTLMTSIIALTFLVGISANYAIAADVEVIEDDVTDGDGDFHQWQFSGTSGASSLVVTLVCGNTSNPSEELDPVLQVQSPSMMKTDDDSFTACTIFSSSIVVFDPGEVEDGCWFTQSRGFSGDTGPYTLTLDLSGPGTISFEGEAESEESSCPFVGGTLLPLDTTALILAGAQTNAVWIMSALAVIGSIAFGALYITSRKN